LFFFGVYFSLLYSIEGVGIAMGYGLDVRGSNSGRSKIFYLHNVQTGSGARPASYPVDTGDSFPVGKVEGREADLYHHHVTNLFHVRACRLYNIQ
jgi:hypothetical protein